MDGSCFIRIVLRTERLIEISRLGCCGYPWPYLSGEQFTAQVILLCAFLNGFWSIVVRNKRRQEWLVTEPQLWLNGGILERPGGIRGFYFPAGRWGDEKTGIIKRSHYYSDEHEGNRAWLGSCCGGQTLSLSLYKNNNTKESTARSAN